MIIIIIDYLLKMSYFVNKQINSIISILKYLMKNTVILDVLHIAQPCLSETSKDENLSVCESESVIMMDANRFSQPFLSIILMSHPVCMDLSFQIKNA